MNADGSNRAPLLHDDFPSFIRSPAITAAM
jgi:hypothetical protein